MTRNPTIRAWFGPGEISAVLFAGIGGQSLGERKVTGRSPDIAVNHWPVAIAAHKANHPETKHFVANVYEVDPVRACEGRPVALLWLSPDCTHHSKAKGGKPRDQKIRGLAWSAIPWAQTVRPRVIMLENVSEWLDWGPVDEDGKPIAARRGKTFRAWIRKLEALGYVIEWRKLRACDYGAPTTRMRLFVIARCDGKPIVWPTPTHGPMASQPYRTAAECIDWSIPCPSIFDRAKPLAAKTEARIARGIRKFVLESARPFVIPVNHGGPDRVDHRVHDIDAPMPTVTGGSRGSHALVTPLVIKAKTHGGGGNDPMRADEPLRTITGSKRGELAIATPLLVRTAHGDVDATGKKRGLGAHDVAAPLGTVCASGTDFAIAVPYLVHRSNGERSEVVDTDGTVHAAQAPRIYDPEKPLGTIVAQGQKHALCTAFLAKHYGGNESAKGGSSLDRAIDTITGQDHHSLVAANLIRYNGDRPGAERVADIETPLSTQDTSRRFALVASFLSRYNGQSTGQRPDSPLGTVDATDRYGLVTVTIDGEEYAIVDIGMRMLTPRELFRANGTDDDVVIDPIWNGKPITKTDQIRLCGNMVPPQWAEALIAANFGEQP